MEEHLKQYAAYELIDFLSDDDFISWSKYPESSNADIWDEVLISFPEKRKMMTNALELIIGMSSQVVTNNLHKKQELWEDIIIAGGIKFRNPRIMQLRRWRNLAAAFVTGLFILAGSYRYYLNTPKSVNTDYSKSVVINMPDESVITLNRNSKLSYSRSWGAGKSREVTLTGEADFQIKHVAIAGISSPSDSFRVHVNGLVTTVMGTKFNIRNRRGVTVISLERGKIRIDFNGKKQPPVFLTPGQELVYNRAKSLAIKTTVNAASKSAWTNNALVLEGTSVSDILNALEDDYGYHVNVADSAILKRRITGTVPMTNENDLIFVLSKILDVRIAQQGKTLTISAK